MVICRTVSDFEEGPELRTIKRKEYVLMRNVLTKGPLTGICIGLSFLFYLDLSCSRNIRAIIAIRTSGKIISMK